MPTDDTDENTDYVYVDGSSPAPQETRRITRPETPRAKSRAIVPPHPEDEVTEMIEMPAPPRRQRTLRETLSPQNVKKASTPIVVTLIMGLATIYFEYRTQAIKDKVNDKTAAVEVKTDKGYETLAPLVRDLQEQVKVLAAQVDLLRQVALNQENRMRPSAAMAQPPQAIQKLAAEPPVAPVQSAPPPATLNEVVAP